MSLIGGFIFGEAKTIFERGEIKHIAFFESIALKRSHLLAVKPRSFIGVIGKRPKALLRNKLAMESRNVAFTLQVNY